MNLPSGVLKLPFQFKQNPYVLYYTDFQLYIDIIKLYRSCLESKNEDLKLRETNFYEYCSIS